MQRIRHQTISEQVSEINIVLRGHYAYYGVAGNLRSLVKVYRVVERYWRKMLCSRSWAGRRLTWDAFHAQFDVDTMHAVECARVAKAHAERPENLSASQLAMSDPAIITDLAAIAAPDLERRILAGDRISGPDIIRARGSSSPDSHGARPVSRRRGWRRKSANHGHFAAPITSAA
jgi:hypothetical protein